MWKLFFLVLVSTCGGVGLPLAELHLFKNIGGAQKEGKVLRYYQNRYGCGHFLYLTPLPACFGVLSSTLKEI